MRGRLPIRVILTGIFICVLPFAAARLLPASYSNKVARTYVEIEGVQFGAFDVVEGLDKTLAASASDKQKYTVSRITLRRDFVTDPSLYLWARDMCRRCR